MVTRTKEGLFDYWYTRQSDRFCSNLSVNLSTIALERENLSTNLNN